MNAFSPNGIWFRRPDLAEANRWQATTIAGPLGIVISEIGDDFMRGTMPVDSRTHQPMGILHGGASVVLAESLGSLAANYCVDTGAHYCVGLDVNANHLRAVRSGEVTGTAKPIHLGKSTQVWDIRIVDDNARDVCIARLTMAVLAR
jgi:1,4-dihydroxy-2-naphthoyl-CoA hydrolase